MTLSRVQLSGNVQLKHLIFVSALLVALILYRTSSSSQESSAFTAQKLPQPAVVTEKGSTAGQPPAQNVDSRQSGAVQVFNCPSFREVIANNRKTLESVPKWITDEDYSGAYYQYGLPEHVRHLIDTDVGPQVMYTDVIAWVAVRMRPKIKYLEIGVSVGKTIYQIAKAVPGITVAALELERINPMLEKLFANKKQMKEWKTMEGSMRTHPSTLSEYTVTSSHAALDFKPRDTPARVIYCSGDEFDDQTWTALTSVGLRFDLVFSDAFHTSDALRKEADRLIANKLLADEFVMFWDDLEGGMLDAFFTEVCTHFQKSLMKPVTCRTIAVNGWLGKNEGAHTVGMAATNKYLHLLDVPLKPSDLKFVPCAS